LILHKQLAQFSSQDIPLETIILCKAKTTLGYSKMQKQEAAYSI
jgi:hypothetical protein